jgi:putative membrane protein
MKLPFAICVSALSIAALSIEAGAANPYPVQGSSAPPASSHPPTTEPEEVANNPDYEFYKAAATGGVAEVELAKLAQEKSKAPEIKEFAAMMVKDHTAANNKLKALAAANDVTLPDDTTLMQKATKKKLEMQSAADFDEAYVKQQIKAHEDTAALMKQEIDGGKDADAKRFATETLPTVEAHLAQITRIAATRGINH